MFCECECEANVISCLKFIIPKLYPNFIIMILNAVEMAQQQNTNIHGATGV